MRAVKNRFGAVNELGVFAMTDKGLQGRQQSIARCFFAATRSRSPAPACWPRSKARGRCWSRSRRWSTPAHSPNPRRLSVGLEQNRLAMLLAVLHRHAGIATWEQDVFVNAVGGVRIAEPAADLAVSLAIVSSLTDRPIPGKVAVFGEIGLAGEVRPAPRGQERLQEAAKLGFTKALIPKANAPKAKIPGLETIPVDHVDQAISVLRNL